MRIDRAIGDPFLAGRRVARELHPARDVRDSMTPEEWIQRRLRSHRANSSADTLQTTRGIAYLVRDHATPDGDAPTGAGADR